MPTTYRTPGVYVEWLDANAQRLDIGRTDVAGFVGVAERGPVQTPVKIESARQFLTTFGDPVGDGYLAYAVTGFFENGGRTCWIVRAADPARAVPARARLLVEGRAPFVLEASSPGAWGNAIEIEAVWGRDRISHLAVRTPDSRGQLAIDLATMGARPAADARRENLLGVADEALPDVGADPIVRSVPDLTSLPLQSLDVRTPRLRLAGGADGLATLTPDHFAGDSDRESRWGAAELERVDNISLVAVPDLMLGQDRRALPTTFPGFARDVVLDTQVRVINTCVRRRDRMAILDLPCDSRDRVTAYAKYLPGSSYAAVYYPWVVVNDPLRIQRNVRVIPPSGHVAGMFARIDRLRGVHRPPANAVLEGVWDLTETIDERAHGDLNEAAINAIRTIPGRGVLVLGARTRCLDDVRWRYVNVRRLFMMIEEALDEQMQWVTFEPNNPKLWREIDRAVRSFLERLYRANMLDGETSDDAYVVRCDETTNPSWETDEGRVTCVIGLQPPYPAEFVVVRIGVTRSGIQIEEKGAQDV